MTDVNLLHDTDSDGDRGGKHSKKQGEHRAVTLTSPREKGESQPINTGGVVQSFFGRIKSLLKRNGGKNHPARILHAQYHDGTPAPHIAPPPLPDAKKTSPGGVGLSQPGVPRVSLPPRREKERAIAQPPAAVAGPMSMPAVQRAPLQPVSSAMQSSPAKLRIQEVEKKGGSTMTSGMPNSGEPPMPGVNLVPEELQTAAGSRNKLAMLGLTAAITVLLVGVVSVGMLLVQQMLVKQAETIKKDIAQMDDQRAKLTAQKRSAIQLHKDTLQAMDILNKHVYWTQFFKQLEAVTIDVVQYRGVTADQAGRVTILASGTDFRSVARQLVAYQQDAAFIKDVSITSASVRQGVGVGSMVDFTATLTLQPGAILLPATLPATAVPSASSTTPSP